MKIDEKQLYTTQETAKIFKVSPITIKRYIADDKIPSIKFNGIRRIKGLDLARILNSTKSTKKYVKQFNKHHTKC